jgi:hypothetical protein
MNIDEDRVGSLEVRSAAADMLACWPHILPLMIRDIRSTGTATLQGRHRPERAEYPGGPRWSLERDAGASLAQPNLKCTNRYK